MHGCTGKMTTVVKIGNRSQDRKKGMPMNKHSLMSMLQNALGGAPEEFQDMMGSLMRATLANSDEHSLMATYPEETNLELVLVVGNDGNATLRQRGTCVRHVSQDMLSSSANYLIEQVAQHVSAAQQCMDEVERLKGLKETAEERLQNWNDALQSVLAALCNSDEGLDPQYLNYCRRGEGKETKLYIEDQRGRCSTKEITDPVQIDRITAMGDERSNLRNEVTTLNNSITANANKAKANASAAERVLKLIAKQVVDQFQTQKEEGLLPTSHMTQFNPKSGQVEIVLTCDVDRKFATFPISHLPESVVNSLGENPLDMASILAATPDEQEPNAEAPESEEEVSSDAEEPETVGANN